MKPDESKLSPERDKQLLDAAKKMDGRLKKQSPNSIDREDLVASVREHDLDCKDPSPTANEWDGKDIQFELTNQSRTATFTVEGEMQKGCADAMEASFDSIPDGVDTVIVNFDSPGGKYVDGKRMGSFFAQNRDYHIVTRAVGQCYSAAAIAFEGGHEREILSTADFMAHHVSPSEEEVKALLSDIQVANQLMAEWFADTNTNGLTSEEFTAKIKEVGDWHMTPTECVANGFADRIVKVEKPKQEETQLAAAKPLRLGDSFVEEEMLSATANGLAALKKIRPLTNGIGLAGLLNETINRIADSTDDERNRRDVIWDLSDSANISSWVVDEILSTEVSCPSKRVLEDFAKVFGMPPFETLLAAARRDGCSYSVVETSACGTVTNNGEPTVFEKWLKAQGLSPEEIKNLSDGERNSWLTAYKNGGGKLEEPTSTDTNVPEADLTNSSAPATAGTDGASLSDLLKNMRSEIKDEIREERVKSDFIEAKLGKYPELKASAIGESWSNEKIELEAYKMQNAIGHEFSAITSKGSAKDLKIEEVIECAMADELGVDYKYLSGIYGENTDNPLTAKERRAMGTMELASFSDQTIDAAYKLKNQLGGNVNMRTLGQAALYLDGKSSSLHAPINLDTDLEAVFSAVQMKQWIAKNCQRVLVAGFREGAFTYRKFVRVISGSYTKTKRFRTYQMGNLLPVPKGGNVEYGKISADGAYDTQLARHALNWKIDECWFDDPDLTSLQQILQGALQNGRRAPEKAFFDLINEKHCNGDEDPVEYNEDYWDAMWETWCKCSMHDPKDPHNKDCGDPIYLDGMKMILLFNKLEKRRAMRMFKGVPQVCSGGADETCSTVYTANFNDEDTDICFSPRLACQKGYVMMPAANDEHPAYVMSTRNGIEVPQAKVFGMTAKDFGVTVQVKFEFNIEEADEHLQKSHHDVADYILAQS